MWFFNHEPSPADRKYRMGHESLSGIAERKRSIVEFVLVTLLARAGNRFRFRRDLKFVAIFAFDIPVATTDRPRSTQSTGQRMLTDVAVTLLGL